MTPPGGRRRRTTNPVLDALELELNAAIADENRAKARVMVCIALARRHGMSWRQIGAMVGMSHEGARQRFGAAEQLFNGDLTTIG